MSPMPPIQVQGLWKRYGLPLMPALRHAWHRLRPGAPPFPRSRELPWALQGIDLTVAPGETLGVIGRNGAGKSSLLKVLAGVSPPTHGRVEVNGTLFPMIELNAGIHMDLTGRENIHLLGAVMGLSPARIAQRLPLIEAFCELGEWLERPVRMYSSGMLVRLGFAVGIHVESDILLMDEVMAVGDLAFHNKCLRQLEEVRGEGRAILFVSHNLLRVRRLCDRVLLLERGRPLFLGHPEEAIARYETLVRESAREQSQQGGGFDFIGVRLVRAEVEDGGGVPVETVRQGETVTFRFTLALESPLDLVNLNLAVESQEAVLVVWEELELPALAAGEHRFAVEWPDLRLKAGFYQLRLTIGTGSFMLKGFRASHPLVVTGAPGDLGVYRPRSRFRRLGGETPAGGGG